MCSTRGVTEPHHSLRPHLPPPLDPKLSDIRAHQSSVEEEAAPRTASASFARRFTIWSLAVTAACLPLYRVRRHYRPPATNPLETPILLTVAGYAARPVTDKPRTARH